MRSKNLLETDAFSLDVLRPLELFFQDNAPDAWPFLSMGLILAFLSGFARYLTVNAFADRADGVFGWFHRLSLSMATSICSRAVLCAVNSVRSRPEADRRSPRMAYAQAPSFPSVRRISCPRQYVNSLIYAVCVQYRATRYAMPQIDSIPITAPINRETTSVV